MIGEISLLIDYSQVIVCLASRENRGLLWTDEHVSQGFAWADGVVSFGVPDHDGECLLQVFTSVEFSITQGAVWAVQVPFNITEALGIGSVFEQKLFNIDQGKYNLVFEALARTGDYSYVIRLHFVVAEEPSFAIIKQGGPVTSDHVLRQSADLAA